MLNILKPLYYFSKYRLCCSTDTSIDKVKLMTKNWPYDCLSLMHYVENADAQPGKITIEAFDKKTCYKKCSRVSFSAYIELCHIVFSAARAWWETQTCSLFATLSNWTPCTTAQSRPTGTCASRAKIGASGSIRRRIVLKRRSSAKVFATER